MTLLWAINFIIAKYALQEIPALLTFGLRTALAGAIIWPVYLWQTRRSSAGRWSRRDLPILLCLGLLGVVLNQMFFVLGLSRTSVAHAAIMIGLTPILVLVIASASGQESIGLVKILGMVLALVGVGVLQTAPPDGTAATLRGDFFVFLAALTFALFTVISKRVRAKFDGLTLNTFAYAGGGLSILPMTLWLGAGFSLREVSWAAWASILYMGIFPSVVCYLIYYYALGHIPASRVSAFSYLQPLLAPLLAIPMLAEYPTKSLVAGGALVLLGVFVTERT